mmetsp:Transcript_103592/g.317157  ORF Transcript_103592/g.317157 Transcript_103592/m.317157 type:complete len:220 (-) Transcript_103592:273-932(-)
MQGLHQQHERRVRAGQEAVRHATHGEDPMTEREQRDQVDLGESAVYVEEHRHLEHTHDEDRGSKEQTRDSVEFPQQVNEKEGLHQSHVDAVHEQVGEKPQDLEAPEAPLRGPLLCGAACALGALAWELRQDDEHHDSQQAPKRDEHEIYAEVVHQQAAEKAAESPASGPPKPLLTVRRQASRGDRLPALLRQDPGVLVILHHLQGHGVVDRPPRSHEGR